MSPHDAPLRIGIVAHAGLGGSGTVATDLAAGLAERGHRLHIITPERPFRLDAGANVEVHALAPTAHAMWPSPPWTLALVSRIIQVIREAELDVLHAHFVVPYAAATELACHMLGAGAPPWIATIHGSDVDPLGHDPAYAPVVRHALLRATRVTSPSGYLRDLATRELVPEVDITTIANFVDPERFRPHAARRAPSEDGATFVHASNFREVKRVGDVIAIFARVAEHSRARLLLIGDGPERPAALAGLAALGLADRVEAPGARSDVERYLQRAHVALLPSERESFGLAALEALASAVPVIGSAVGGLPEVVEHGRTGFLAEVGDVDAMAAAARALITDDARWHAMALAARAHAVARFSPASALDAYLALYRSAIRDPTSKYRNISSTPLLHDS